MKRILLYIALVLAAVGCSKPIEVVDQSGETGQLKFESVKIIEQAEELLAPRAPQTRTEADKLLIHILSVTITDKASGQIVEHYADHSTMPATIVLKAGQYTISARTADINGQIPFGMAGFEQPQYAGTQDVTIVSGELSSIALNCPQATAGVTVAYSDLFQEIYPCAKPSETYRVRVFSSYGGDLVFLKGETRTAHFTVPTADMKLFYQISVDRVNKDGFLETVTGVETQFEESVMPVRKACNYNLTIKVLNQ